MPHVAQTPPPAPAVPGEVVLAQGYARRKHLAVGSTIVLNQRPYKVVGLARPPLGGQSAEEHVEDVLGRLRSKQPPTEWPVLSNVRTMPGRAWLSRIRRPGAIAAAVTLVVGASWLASRPIESGWTVARMEGAPTINAKIMRATGQLAVGQWLITDHASRAKIDVGEIGEVELEPDSRLRLVRARQTDHRLALARGTMRAMIWAPPRLFSVETPSAVAVDLGCTYTLEVDKAGISFLY